MNEWINMLRPRLEQMKRIYSYNELLFNVYLAYVFSLLNIMFRALYCSDKQCTRILGHDSI